MDEDFIIKCLIAFVIGYLAGRVIGNGFNVGGQSNGGLWANCNDHFTCPSSLNGLKWVKKSGNNNTCIKKEAEYNECNDIQDNINSCCDKVVD